MWSTSIKQTADSLEDTHHCRVLGSFLQGSYPAAFRPVNCHLLQEARPDHLILTSWPLPHLLFFSFPSWTTPNLTVTLTLSSVLPAPNPPTRLPPHSARQAGLSIFKALL